MKNKLFFSSIFLLLFSCNDWENVESFDVEDPTATIAGMWYMEITDDSDLNMFSEYYFTPFGRVIYINEYRKRNGYKNDEQKGNYSFDGNKITMSVGSSTYDVEFSDEPLTLIANLKTHDESIRPFHIQFMRIVDTVLLNVGDTMRLEDLQQKIEEYTTKPTIITYCEMIDNAIALVSETGLLTAKLAGVTYLKVVTDNGVAILKIIITDKGNLWPDFSKGLGMSFDEVECLFGKRYFYRNDSICYFYDNDYIDRVRFFQHYGMADSIIVSFKENASEDSILIYLNNSLNKVEVNDSLSYQWYTDNENCLLSTYSAKYYKEEEKLVYTSFEHDWDDRRYDYGLTTEQLYEKYGKKPKINGQISYPVKNDFIIEISYFVNVEGKVYGLSGLLNVDVDAKVIDGYIKKKYKYYDYDNDYKYGANIYVNGEEVLLLVSRKNNTLKFHFIQNK